jgi:uncharacterized protein (DUF305 family)
MKLNGLWIGLLIGATASAQMTMEMPPSGSKFTQEMNTDMQKMDRGMAGASMNGKVDHDFAAMMIPHHQGAIDMAKGELSYGSDPVMRRLAEEIIVDQQSEIDLMNLWLKKHAADKGSNSP